MGSFKNLCKPNRPSLMTFASPSAVFIIVYCEVFVKLRLKLYSSVTFACPRRLVGEVPECGEGELERDVEVVLHHPVPHDREQLLHVAGVGPQLASLLGGDLGRQDGADRHRHPEHEEDLIFFLK